MQFCTAHWEILKAEVNKLGLAEWQLVHVFIASCPQCLTLITVYVPLTLKLIWNNGQPQVEVTGEAIYDSHFCNLN